MSNIEIPTTREQATIPLAQAAEALGLSKDQLRYKLIKDPTFLGQAQEGSRHFVSTADLRKALGLKASQRSVKAQEPTITRRPAPEASAEQAQPAKAAAKASKAPAAKKAPAKKASAAKTSAANQRIRSAGSAAARSSSAAAKKASATKAQRSRRSAA
jgi:hypothetical protein